MRDSYKIPGEHSKIPLIHLAVYGFGLKDSYIEIFDKSLLFHEGKLNENGQVCVEKLSEEYDGFSHMEVYPEDFLNYEEFLKQIEIANK